ncbi:MAG: CDP-alcohol phosphatidyltransferase family protein [Thermodesulfobacteria bacterium]|nr:CDP-alcohol phosphatidyltransferase family protein [Thermodesulfobacteriota bacterium]
MATYYVFLGKNETKVWGLTVGERLSRLLSGKAEPLPPDHTPGKGDRVLIFRLEFLLDDRLVRYLLTQENLVLVEQGVPLAAVVSGDLYQPARKFLEDPRGALPDSVQIKELREITGAFFQQLRKFEPPFALRVTPETRARVERRLYDWSYKGVTDLVTKWLWPLPARWVVRLCVKLGLKPNHVTFIGFLLVVLAGYLFYQGHLGWGLVAAWLMTFLDTVDGKLARVTVTSSKFGHYFDHIIDLVHPPIWYVLWALGAQRAGLWEVSFPFGLLVAALVAGYVLGRVVEGLFTLLFGFEIFCWRPLDSFFRLITARRNPCLLILTLSFVLGRPDLGFLAVVFWTVATSLFLLLRLLYALWLRRRGVSISPWLADVERFSSHRLAIKWFTRRQET